MFIIYTQYLYLDYTEWHSFCNGIYMCVCLMLNIFPMEIHNGLSLLNYAQKQGERIA